MANVNSYDVRQLSPFNEARSAIATDGTGGALPCRGVSLSADASDVTITNPDGSTTGSITLAGKIIHNISTKTALTGTATFTYWY